MRFFFFSCSVIYTTFTFRFTRQSHAASRDSHMPADSNGWCIMVSFSNFLCVRKVYIFTHYDLLLKFTLHSQSFEKFRLNRSSSLVGFVFPIMWRYPGECFLSKLDIFLLARSLFNEQDKGLNLLGFVTCTRSVLAKQNRQAKIVYCRIPRNLFGFYWIRITSISFRLVLQRMPPRVNSSGQILWGILQLQQENCCQWDSN